VENIANTRGSISTSEFDLAILYQEIVATRRQMKLLEPDIADLRQYLAMLEKSPISERRCGVTSYPEDP